MYPRSTMLVVALILIKGVSILVANLGQVAGVV